MLGLGARRGKSLAEGQSLVGPARLFAIATLFYWAALYVYVPILPVYALSLGASLTVVGLVVSAYGLGQLVLRVPIGVASDRLGSRKPFCIAGLLIASLACLALMIAPSPGWLIVGRTIAGISAATWVAITVMYSDYFDGSQVTRAMAQLTVLSGLAQLASTSMGGWLADVFGWHAPFAAGVAIGVVGAGLLLVIPEAHKTRGPAPSWGRMARVGTGGRLLRIAIVAAFLQFAFWAMTYTFVPLYAHDLGASRTVLGLLTGGALIPYTLAAFGVSRWSSRLGSWQLAVVGLLVCAGATAAVPLIRDVVLLGISQAISGLGRGLTMPVLLGLSIHKVAPEEKATAMGVYQAVYALGMFFGPASAGFVAQGIGLTGAFLLSAVICVLGAALLLGSGDR